MKIIVAFPEDAWHGVATEGLWASKPLNGGYVLANIPFFATGLACGDLVEAEQRSDGGLYLTRVVADSGHSTYRVLILDKEPEKLLASLKVLEEMGCSYEGLKLNNTHIIAIDVPPSAIDSVYAFLEQREGEGLWDFEEGKYTRLQDQI